MSSLLRVYSVTLTVCQAYPLGTLVLSWCLTSCRSPVFSIRRIVSGVRPAARSASKGMMTCFKPRIASRMWCWWLDVEGE
jgi:hypothetical protein